MKAEEILATTVATMERATEFMIHEFHTIRTGKASPVLVESIDVTAYGSSMKLKQLALITAPEPRMLVIQPFDTGTLHDIERAIQESKIGINPTVDGKLIRLRIPELSEERRKDLVKTIHKIAEDSRVRVRAARREAIENVKKLEKDGMLTEDDLKHVEKEIQKLTDKQVDAISKHVVSKEEELMIV